MAKYQCEVCKYVYDEEKEGTKWEDLPEDWTCPFVNLQKKYSS